MKMERKPPHGCAGNIKRYDQQKSRADQLIEAMKVLNSGKGQFHTEVKELYAELRKELGIGQGKNKIPYEKCDITNGEPTKYTISELNKLGEFEIYNGEFIPFQFVQHGLSYKVDNYETAKEKAIQDAKVYADGNEIKWSLIDETYTSMKWMAYSDGTSFGAKVVWRRKK